ncbi:LysM peptidoglycan-binding domain-containing protein [Ornithinimicrobium murale]|uniref:LysM peptidoglycan-binding domain-containing protein n=1 Tax=Ornithinimicrobium murale TaxID=1050153 RepID=UPI000E0D974B|nr:LysM peptidoglycan-binding domain-containing protein [Ornithinimicrobium murale]
MSPVADLPPVLHVQTPVVDLANRAPLGRLATSKKAWQDYRVKSGDTLYDLADTYDTTVSALAKRNGITGYLHAGAVIEVPRKAASSGSGSGSSSSSTPSAKVTVRPGDTLSHISARHDVSVSAIIKANKLPSAMIYPGQRLSVPGSKSASAPKADNGSDSSSSATGATVTVRSGDTLSGISARHDISLSALLNANPGVNARGLQVGQKVSLPASATRTSAYRDGEGAKEGAPNTFLHYTYSDEVAGSAAANREHLAQAPVPSRDEMSQIIRETAKRHGVSPDLMLALSYMESGWNHRSVSPANAIGAMQVIPSTGDWASAMVGRELNLLDPHDNATAGVVVMRALLRSADNEDQAIAGYYQGLAGVQNNGMYPDTKNYVKAIQGLRDRM